MPGHHVLNLPLHAGAEPPKHCNAFPVSFRFFLVDGHRSTGEPPKTDFRVNLAHDAAGFPGSTKQRVDLPDLGNDGECLFRQFSTGLLLVALAGSRIIGTPKRFARWCRENARRPRKSEKPPGACVAPSGFRLQSYGNIHKDPVRIHRAVDQLGQLFGNAAKDRSVGLEADPEPTCAATINTERHPGESLAPFDIRTCQIGHVQFHQAS